MGHYWSEMVSDAELERDRKRKMKQRDALVAGLERAITDKGVAEVIANILDSDQPLGGLARWYREYGK